MKKKPPVRRSPAVTAQQVLDAVFELQRLGPDRALHRLEANEPSLAEYLLEGLSALHHKLFELGARARATRQVYLQTQQLCLLYTSPSPRDRTRSRMPSSA